VWQAFCFGYNVTEPTASNTTVVNMNSTTVSYAHGGISMFVPAGVSTNNLIGCFQAIPASGAYYVDIAYLQFVASVNAGAGAGLSDGTTSSNKIATMKYGYEPGLDSGNFMMERQEYNNYSSFNNNSTATPNTAYPFLVTGPLVWMRIYDDRTTYRTWYISADGYNWIQAYQESRTHFNGSSLIPAEAGFWAGNYLSSWSSTYHLVHLSIHT
jgi:hypothetical protein